MASRLRYALKIAGATAALALAFAAPAQAAVTHSSGTAARTAAAPQETVTERYGPYSTYLACDDEAAYFIGAPNIAHVSSCIPTWQGYYLYVTFYIVTTY